MRDIIYERIGILLSLSAKELKKKDEKRARRYVFLARKLSTRYNCRFSKQDRLRFCKSCGLPSIAGLNTKVRLRARERKVEYACSCGAIRTAGY